jgi:hypothetical protein
VRKKKPASDRLRFLESYSNLSQLSPPSAHTAHPQIPVAVEC